MERNIKTWRENANAVLVVYSILAATCGIIITFVLQDSQDKLLGKYWYIAICFLGVSLWLFIFSAEGLTDALDEDYVYEESELEP